MWDGIVHILSLIHIYVTITIAENAQISNNMTKNNGGGISLFPAKLVVSGGKIQNNTADVGGGIASYADGDITMTDGEISGNTAISGGGIYPVSYTHLSWNMRAVPQRGIPRRGKNREKERRAIPVLLWDLRKRNL